MHESQLARRVLDVVLARAREAGAVRVRTVRGRLGELEALSAAALAFHFRALARGTVAEDAELDASPASRRGALPRLRSRLPARPRAALSGLR